MTKYLHDFVSRNMIIAFNFYAFLRNSRFYQMNYLYQVYSNKITDLITFFEFKISLQSDYQNSECITNIKENCPYFDNLWKFSSYVLHTYFDMYFYWLKYNLLKFGKTITLQTLKIFNYIIESLENIKWHSVILSHICLYITMCLLIRYTIP